MDIHYPEIHYQKEGGGIKVTACYGEDGCIYLPELIEGIPVTAIGAYGFSDGGEAPEDLVWRPEESSGRSGEREKLQTESVQELYLPDGVREIGRYAFYRCRNLEKLSLSDSLLEIGGGALTGCRPGRIEIHLRRGEQSALRSILDEVRFAVRATLFYHRADGRVETAKVLFPEHYEEAVENTPARLLYTSHHGAGGYYRQCFYDRKLDFQKYDALLPRAVAEETPEIVTELAVKRLQFPVGLSGRAREQYQDFLREHGAQAAAFLVAREEEEGLRLLLDAGLLGEAAFEAGIETALSLGKTALVSLLMEERGRRFPKKKKSFEL